MNVAVVNFNTSFVTTTLRHGGRGTSGVVTTYFGDLLGGVGWHRNPGLHVFAAAGTFGRQAFPVTLLHHFVFRGLPPPRTVRLHGARSAGSCRAMATTRTLHRLVLRAEHRQSDAVDVAVRSLPFPDARSRQWHHSRRLLRVPVPRL